MANVQSQRRLLITGAGGFVGRHLIREALLPDRSWGRIAAGGYQTGGPTSPIDARIEPQQLDITDRRHCDEVVATFRPTHVVHLAAISHVPTAAADPSAVWNVNVLGTLNLLESIRVNAAGAVFLFVSSSEVYGRSFQSGLALDETALLQPRNHYATTKAAADMMAGQYAEAGLRVIRVRPFNHIGPGQTPEFVVSSFASQIARIEKGLQPPLIKVGNLDAARDFLDVRDVVRGYIDLLEKSGDLPNGAVFNVCSGIARPIRSVLEELVALSNSPCEVALDPARLRRADTPKAIGIQDKLKRVTGWQPRHDLKATLSAILEDWRQRTMKGGA